MIGIYTEKVLKWLLKSQTDDSSINSVFILVIIIHILHLNEESLF